MSGFVLPAIQASGEATSGWANNVRAALEAITNPARAFLYQASATTTVANSSTTWTPISFDTAAYDTESGYSGGSPTKWTCPTGWAGYYQVIANVVYDDASTGARRLTVARNGTAVTGRTVGPGAVANGSVDLQVVHEMLLDEGDYVEAWGRQSSGSGLHTLISGTRTSSLSVCWKAAA